MAGRTGVLCLLLAAGLVPGSSALADDRDLQAILAKQNCRPARISRTDLSRLVIVYEVTCKGKKADVISVVCLDNQCQMQPKRRDDEER